jgi:uncharacterized sulfatase
MRIRGLVVALITCANFFIASTLYAANPNTFDYKLKAVKVAQNTYIFEGKREDFSFENGGNIVNTAFIVTKAGVVVIDTGSSRKYGEQQRAAIAEVTDKPIVGVYLTHHHPDHFLGNQAYEDTSIYALPETEKAIGLEGEDFRSNMYVLVGDWMRGTVLTKPSKNIKVGKQIIGEHQLEFFSVDGHTASDLIIFDHTTGVLFTGDVVFNQRTATTPHANVGKWQKTLAELKNIPFKVLVPGHGPISTDISPIDQTSNYLAWLVTTLKQAASYGMDMNEVMRTEIPEEFKSLDLVDVELTRSVTHLYPAYENGFLKPLN